MGSAMKGISSLPEKKQDSGEGRQLSLLLPGFERSQEHRDGQGKAGEQHKRDEAPEHGERAAAGFSTRARKMEAMGALAAGIAHDFNNILTPILLRAEMAMAQLGEDNPMRYQLEQILSCGRRARDLVQQILNFSRQNDGERRPLQISLVVKEMVKFLRSSLPASIEIRQDIRGAGMVLADLGLIHLLVIELGIRSAHAMGRNGGTLEVALCDVEVDGPEYRDLLYLPKGPYVKLSVKQTVHGDLPEEEGAEQAGMEDAGPDLAQIRGIVEQHGGKMVVYKETGEGVTIHTFLPRMESKASAGEGKISLPARGSETVLLVDDEPAVLETLKQMLDYLGYTVVSSTSSVEALEIFRAGPERFDVVITDEIMPRMSGIRLAEEINRIRPNLPILLCSGFDEILQDRELGRFGVQALLVKPLTAREIAGTIRQVLNGTPESP